MKRLEDLQALILCGGLGQRLRSVVSDRPKCLGVVAGRPFLEFLLLWLKSSGLRKVILCVGHRNEQVKEYAGAGERWNLELTYSVESEPLGTGGAVKQAQPLVRDGPFLVLNGDSFLDLGLAALVAFHEDHAALGTLALGRISEGRRYGSVRVGPTGEVTGFFEKGQHERQSEEGQPDERLINAGAYVFSEQIFERISAVPPPVSLETDVFPRLVNHGLYGFVSDGYFIDIGVPEDYARAQTELPGRFLL